MRMVPVLLLVAGACGGAELTAPGTDTGPVYVPGVVIDSVTRQRLPGVTLYSGTLVATTDASGAFMIPREARLDTLHVSAAGYEPFAQVLPIGPDHGVHDTLQLQLRRTGPFPVRCMMTELGFCATIVDLQGRPPLAQLSGSILTLIDASRYRDITVAEWQVEALDAVEWRVTIADATPPPGYAFWEIRQSGGPGYQGGCQPSGFPPEAP